MNCRKARAGFDGLLGGNDPHGVADHIQGCAACAERFVQWKALAQTLRSAPPVKAPPDLKVAIRRAVAEASRQGRKAWSWSLVPPVPVWGFAMAALVVMAAGGWWFMRGPATVPAPVATDSGPLLTIEVELPQASTVAVAGDFNGWNTSAHFLKRSETGRWMLSLAVPRGVHEYLLLVDGTTWVLDPGNPVRVPDGFGGYNSGVEL